MTNWRAGEPSWARHGSNERSERRWLSGPAIPLSELIAYVREVAPNHSFDDVEVGNLLVHWTRPGTAEEIAERERHQAERDRRHATWEARMMRSLIERYGPDTTAWPVAEGD